MSACTALRDYQIVDDYRFLAEKLDAYDVSQKSCAPVVCRRDATVIRDEVAGGGDCRLEAVAVCNENRP